MAVAVALIALLAGGASAAALTVNRATVPHRTTTAWLRSRPLAADASGAAAMGPEQGAMPGAQAGSSWQLASDIVPTGWKLGTAGPGPGVVTCPTTDVCYVTGDTSTDSSGPSVLGGLYVSTDGAGSWSVLALPPGFTFTSELACVTALICAAGGMENSTTVLAETRDGGHRWTVTTTGAAGALVHLACVSADRCMALSTSPATASALADGTPTPQPFAESFVRTTDAGSTWTATALPATVRYSALQCASATACVTIGYPAATGGTTPRGVALWTDDGGARWRRGSLPPGVGFSAMSALACAAPTRCTAVATISIPNPSRCATVLPLTQDDTGTGSTRVSCTTGATVWLSTMVATRTGGATWQEQPLPTSLDQPELDSVACAGALTCWAAGTESTATGRSTAGSVFVGTTDGGATWAKSTVTVPAGAPNDEGHDAYMAVGSVSCPSASVCVALGVVDQGASFAPVYRMAATP